MSQIWGCTASLGREFQPGEHWSYASGTTNILCRMLGDILAGGDVASVGAEKRKNAIEQFAKERLFGPIGASSPIMKFDATGTFVGSSFVYATARDFAAFGELYRRGGARQRYSDSSVGLARPRTSLGGA